MKHVFALLLVVASANAAVADAELSEKDTKSWLGVFDKIVDAVVAHRADCRTMAGDINGIIHVNQGAIKQVRDAKAAGKKFPASAAQHMVDGSKRMIASLDKCGRDEEVAAAFARIDLGGRGK